MELLYQPPSTISRHITVDFKVVVINVHRVDTVVRSTGCQYVRTVTSNLYNSIPRSWT